MGCNNSKQHATDVDDPPAVVAAKAAKTLGISPTARPAKRRNAFSGQPEHHDAMMAAIANAQQVTGENSAFSRVTPRNAK